jgi:hypothetical protein
MDSPAGFKSLVTLKNLKPNDSGKNLGGKTPQATESVLTKLLTSTGLRTRRRTRTVGPNPPFFYSPVRCLILTSKVLAKNH